jgi:hypothetical protein
MHHASQDNSPYRHSSHIHHGTSDNNGAVSTSTRLLCVVAIVLIRLMFAAPSCLPFPISRTARRSGKGATVARNANNPNGHRNVRPFVMIRLCYQLSGSVCVCPQSNGSPHIMRVAEIVSSGVNPRAHENNNLRLLDPLATRIPICSQAF